MTLGETFVDPAADKGYSRTLILVLFIQTIVVTCLILAMIVELYNYENIWLYEIIQRGVELSYQFIGDYWYPCFYWFCLVVGVWFQLFWAIDAHRSRNAVQALLVPIFNAILFFMQLYSYSLMNQLHSCYLSVKDQLANAFLQYADSSIEYTMVYLRESCIMSHSSFFREEESFLVDVYRSKRFESHHQFLINAHNFSLATLIIISVVLIITSFWTLQIHRREMISGFIKIGQQSDSAFRYSSLKISLKLYIYFAICASFYLFYGVVVVSTFDEWSPSNRTTTYPLIPDNALLFLDFVTPPAIFVSGYLVVKRGSILPLVLLVMSTVIRIYVDWRRYCYFFDAFAPGETYDDPYIVTSSRMDEIFDSEHAASFQ